MTRRLFATAVAGVTIPETDSIVTWTARGQRHLGRVLGTTGTRDRGAAAIVRDIDGVTRTVWCTALSPAKASPSQLRALGVAA